MSQPRVDPGSSPTSDAKILLVDDETSLLDAVGYTLVREGYAVTKAETGTDALGAVRSEPPDLIVLDVMLPGLDGLQVCQAIRAESTVPILLLSAKGEEVDRVIGLEMGADDYLAKPFAMRELLARVRAMLRRSRMVSRAHPRPPGTENGVERGPPRTDRDADDAATTITAGDLIVDPARRRVLLGDAALTLKPKEFDLLHYLMRHPGIVFSRDTLLRRVWGYDYAIDTRTVDVHVRWLRQKIERDASRPRRLETIRGVGYRFIAGAEPENIEHHHESGGGSGGGC